MGQSNTSLGVCLQRSRIDPEGLLDSLSLPHCTEPSTQQVLTGGTAWAILAFLCSLCELQGRRTGPYSLSACSLTL